MATPNPPTTLVSWLDDLTVRFLLNLPASELSSVPRLCFQVEEAQWYYEDFVRPFVAASGLPPLPSLPLRQFCLLLFQHCPLLSGFTDAQHIAAYEEFLAYKVRVPVRGAILLDEDMEKVVLVRGWKKGASWSFPRGKINKDERDLDCAIREVYEETGYNVRQAGLVPEKEEEVKYIDITMREQHMRLFVFRGVSEDTYFEPRTRKEISKISWYSIRDLPGFKKQKGHGDGEGVNANKFYMVAPFLGPLKKWIGAQKKRNKTVTARPVSIANGRAAQTAMEEEEEEVEEERTPEREVEPDPRSEDLKRLLSIGEPVPATSLTLQPTLPVTNAGDLLAMLRSSAKATNGTDKPHTPFEQINAFPLQPETPQPDHLRHPSLSQQQRQPPPPQFPMSPERLQQQQQQQEQQRHGPTHTPQIFGPGPGFQQNQPHGFQGMPPPPHMQQQYLNQRQSTPGSMGGVPYPQRNGAPMRQPVHPTQMPPQSHVPPPLMMQQQHQPRPSNVHPMQRPQGSTGPQGPQGAIGSGPAVPNASQLPPPRLNAQSMKLLDAFKSGANKATTAAGPAPAQTQRPPSTHQTALLDLFRKPSSSQSPAIQSPAAPVDEPASPALTDVTVKPSKSRERRPTMNEITRTIPMKPKVTSPPILEPEAHSRDLPSVPGSESERTRSRELFKPTNPVKSRVMSKGPPPAVVQEAQKRPVPTTPQPAPPKPASRSPRPRYATKSGSPSRKDVTKALQDGTSGAPPVTILARPGSARGAPSPAPPLSPARSQTTQKTGFQPQLLKRPKASVDAVSDKEQQKPADKKDQLLALFGKTSSPSPAAQAPPSAPIEQPNDRQNALLGLFSQSSSQQPTPSPAPALAPTPPPAPRIEPERRPSSRTAPPTTSKPQQQNLLLDLFHKHPSTSAQGTPLTSPGTPISPFTLGTPARSRLGSVASIQSDGSSTPTEAKEFLMGYLNGVVRNEGLRGAGARRR
ncbi:mRNA-decapping enzyme subunit 2 [Vermiconidia calcicola]|uniref:mRNA-decapping enzyme subunit 2 n=1 Tax=Vermiconidia calcicola TaxID=1690605 RepID=A0ACC3ME01_9PEZI|nr:mRNA-decapping enzyme subunit 2 [Vermiconidia calcicola]